MVSINGGSAKWMENPLKKDDLGVPPILGNYHIYIYIRIFIYICIYIHISIYIRIFICIFIFTFIFIFIFLVSRIHLCSNHLSMIIFPPPKKTNKHGRARHRVSRRRLQDLEDENDFMAKKRDPGVHNVVVPCGPEVFSTGEDPLKNMGKIGLLEATIDGEV